MLFLGILTDIRRTHFFSASPSIRTVSQDSSTRNSAFV